MSRILFITGAASGIGRHLVERALAAGERVQACDIDEAGLGSLPDSDRLQRDVLDVRDLAAWQRVVGQCRERWGDIDVLMNVAGVIRPGFLREVTEADIDFHLDVNTKGCVNGSRVALDALKRPGGHLINIASLAGIAAVPGLALYSASKFAVRGFTLAIAAEFAELGLHVTCVCPDAVQTPMLVGEQDFEAAAMAFSGDRVLTVEEIGDLIFGPVLSRAPTEVTIPRGRGALARLASAFPGLEKPLLRKLWAKGERARRARLEAAEDR